MSQSISNGLSVDIPVQATHSLKLAWLGGTYTAQIISGAANVPVALATNSASNQTFGPYATAIMVRLTVSAIGRVAWDTASAPAFIPPGEQFTRQDDGIPVTLSGVGPAAEFAVDGDGKMGAQLSLVLQTAWTAEAAAENTARIQAALDACALIPRPGTVRLLASSLPVPLGATLRIADNTTLDATDVELKAFSAIGSLLVTKAFVDPGAAVAVTWSSGMTASVGWTAHGRSVGDWVWLNRADQAQFCGVFRVESVTNADTFVVRCSRIPTATGTGPIVGRVAHTNVRVKGGRWNYNTSGGNTGTNSALHAMVLAGVQNLAAETLQFADTSKYCLCLGAVRDYKVLDVGGNALASDVVKVYGPAHDGRLSGIQASKGNDDFLSFQTREPVAFVAYDFCHGDVLGAVVDGLSGSSTTGCVLLYASPHGIIDGVTVRGAGSSLAAATPQCRIETVYTSGTSEVGTVTLEHLRAEDSNTLVSLGSGTGFLVIRNLEIVNPVMRNASNVRRLIDVQGTNVVAQINVRGGWVSNYDNLINCNANGQAVNLSIYGMRASGGVNAFRGSTGNGALSLSLHDVVFESMPGTSTFSAAAGTGVVNLRCTGAAFGTAPVVSMGAGSALRLSGPCNLQLDGTALDATVANHAPGASFYNTNAGFGAGVGAYVRGSATWTRVAA